jgi:hypothetical protein
MASPMYQFATMLNNPKPLLSKAHVTSLNLSHFKMVEAVELKMIASRSH